ncbi:sigma-70 family RNA polymerase sigma factor [Streptomyces sp. NBC_00669]|uniref:RNA polymerase sigma factor n=1 Tax=Streptomyces sp. NBC_00669 TaxID=2976011 RepID=UPI002E352F90|nr:sigma-70 family RNA polymerase sigma factor [Streptomyces sp. NBC_00669]
MSKPPFEQIVTEHGPMVLRVVRAVLGPHDAEDALSETFLAALRAYPELPGDANVAAWLVTVAHRKAIDVTRANARRPVPAGVLPERPSAAGRPEDWDPDLWRALKALPERQRHAVAYHYLAGLPYKEIAAVTGGSTDAARRAAADGMRTLRRTYPAHPDPDPDPDPDPETDTRTRTGTETSTGTDTSTGTGGPGSTAADNETGAKGR